MNKKVWEYFGLGTPIWMQSRKSLFLFFCIDFILFLLIKTENFKVNLNLRSISVTIFLSIFWCLISYISGRYSYFKDTKIFYNKIYKLLIKTLITITIVYISDKLLIIITSEVVPFGRDSIFLLGVFSFIVQSIKLVIYNKKQSNTKLFLLGKDLDINNFKSMIKPFVKNRNIELINITRDNIGFLKNESILIFDNSLDEEEFKYIYENSIKLNLTILSPCKWCEEFLHKIPIKYLINNYQSNDWILNPDIFQWRLKRFGDIFISLILITLSIPLLIIASLLIWFEDKGPILYYQIRTGLGGKEFKIAKLRTMKKSSEQNGAVWASKNDKRITKVGKFLRQTRIDELPQLISVIIGDMSLIGPRPERPEIEMILKKNIPLYELRNVIKPGLSGWAQVNYPYGASIDDSKNKLSYDLFYIKNYSFWLDFFIFIKTIKLVINMNGSYPLK